MRRADEISAEENQHTLRLSTSMLLTLDASSGRQRPCDDDECVIVSNGRFGQHGGDGVARPRRDGSTQAAAAGRIHVEGEVGVALRKQGTCGSEHRLLQMKDKRGRRELHCASGKRRVAIAAIAQLVGNEGSRRC